MNRWQADKSEMKLNGAKQTERGQMMRRAVGMAGKMAGRQTKPAEQGTAGEHSRRTLRSAQASQQTDGPQLAGLAAKQQQLPQMMKSASRAGKWGEYRSAGPQGGGLRPTYHPYPT